MIFHDGEVIIEEGSMGTDIYRLVSTQHGLRVSIKGKDISSITRPGEYFGEMSVILNEKRSATISSVGRSVVQIFSGDNLEMILENYPQLSKIIIDALAKRLFDLTKKIASENSPGTL